MTMIRINLLPVRQVKKREMGRQFLVIVAGTLVAALAGNFLWYSNREAEANKRQGGIDETNRRIAALDKQIGEVNELKKRKAEVEEKLATLEKLKKQRNGPVRLLDAMTFAIPKKVYVGDFDEKEGALRLTGVAESLEDVSEFMKALQSIRWTPKGMGRVVEQKRDAAKARVELLSNNDGAIEDFEVRELAPFFTNVELKQTDRGEVKGKTSVRFEFSMTANYAT